MGRSALAGAGFSKEALTIIWSIKRGAIKVEIQIDKRGAERKLRINEEKTVKLLAFIIFFKFTAEILIHM